MAIKDLIVNKHKEAEKTLFFQKLIQKKLPKEVWANFIFNKMMILSSIEKKLNMKEFFGLSRVDLLKNDLINTKVQNYQIKKTTFNYIDYVDTLDGDNIFAHVYVWYMGDLNGGKVIKKIVEGDCSSLDFVEPELLKEKILNKTSVDMIEEINGCFDWVIKLLNEFEKDIVQEIN